MNHFIELSQLSREQILTLMDRADFFKNSSAYPTYPQHTIAQLFYENSTRTRVSFELAAKRLGMTSVNLDCHHSSEAKGEVLLDTINTLAAMGIKGFVIRHAQNHTQAQLAQAVDSTVRIINAGDGTHAHPSQALLDMMTIRSCYPELNKVKIAIVGNLRHSRVANSLQIICQKLAIPELSLIAPPIWQPEILHYGKYTSSLEEGLADADVVITLRIQKERIKAEDHLDEATYRAQYAITKNTLSYAKPSAIIMHPGPINRGMEIDTEVADGQQSLILSQVTNGVFIRMAILEAVLNH